MAHITPRLSHRASGLLIALSLLSTPAAFAQSDTMPPQPGGPRAMVGGMPGHSPRSMAEHVDRLLDESTVSEAERGRIRQIAQAAAADIASQRDAGRALHAQAMRLFAAPVVDANAAEQLRQQMVAQHDRGSRRRLQAMLEISALLTPEQRVALMQKMERRGGSMHERMHGRRPAQPRQ